MLLSDLFMTNVRLVYDLTSDLFMTKLFPGRYWDQDPKGGGGGGQLGGGEELYLTPDLFMTKLPPGRYWQSGGRWNYT